MLDKTRDQIVLTEADMDRVSDHKLFGVVVEKRRDRGRRKSPLLHLYVEDDESYYYVTTFAEGWLPDLIGLLQGLQK